MTIPPACRQATGCNSVGYQCTACKFLPELVTRLGDDGYAVAYEKLTGVLIAAVKELKVDTDAQQQHIAALEARLATLEQTVAAPQVSGWLSFPSLSAG